MTNKEFMNQVIKLSKLLSRLESEFQALSDATTNITGVITGMPHKPSKDPHQAENIIVRKIDVENTINEYKVKLREAKNSILHYINTIDDAAIRSVLIDRYINCKSWQDVAGNSFFSESYIKHTCAKIISHLEITEKTRNK